MYVNCKIYVNSNRSHVPIARRQTVIEFAFLFQNPQPATQSVVAWTLQFGNFSTDCY
jgi:hypothetical protein